MGRTPINDMLKLLLSSDTEKINSVPGPSVLVVTHKNRGTMQQLGVEC